MKSAVVFGGSGFLGRELTVFLADHGYKVSCVYHSHKPVFCDDISSSLNLLPCDITDPGSVGEIFRKAVACDGIPAVVINAAGTALKQALLTDSSPAEISDLIQTDLTAALYISREAASVMHSDHSGSIIHISSMWGTVGASCEVAYSAAKGGLNAMVKALAKELAPDGIRVNAIAPGLILSPMNSHLSQEDLALFKEDTPLNCFITPQDICRAVSYLIESPHVTGQILAVDGGIVI